MSADEWNAKVHAAIEWADHYKEDMERLSRIVLTNAEEDNVVPEHDEEEKKRKEEEEKKKREQGGEHRPGQQPGQPGQPGQKPGGNPSR